MNSWLMIKELISILAQKIIMTQIKTFNWETILEICFENHQYNIEN